MSKAKLKKYLLTLPREHLVQVILDLYDARKEAKEYLEFFMEPDTAAALEKAKKELYRNYFTPQGSPRVKISVKAGSDIVNDFIRLDIPAEQVADLTIYHVEVLMTRLVVRHVVRETVWSSLIKVFRKMAEQITAYGLRHLYERRIEKIIEYTQYTPSYLGIEEKMNAQLSELNYYDAE